MTKRCLNILITLHFPPFSNSNVHFIGGSELHSTVEMSIVLPITACLKSTPTHWLLTLSHTTASTEKTRNSGPRLWKNTIFPFLNLATIERIVFGFLYCVFPLFHQILVMSLFCIFFLFLIFGYLQLFSDTV